MKYSIPLLALVFSVQAFANEQIYLSSGSSVTLSPNATTTVTCEASKKGNNYFCGCVHADGNRKTLTRYDFVGDKKVYTFLATYQDLDACNEAMKSHPSCDWPASILKVCLVKFHEAFFGRVLRLVL